MDAPKPFFETLGSVGESYGDPLPVTLSPELIGLLSDQLYRSPAKSIEELIINGFDAEATEARVFVPFSGDNQTFIVVHDDGTGMTYDGLADLWKVGRPKPRDGTMPVRMNRKQIGKFGIGKLSTYAVANRVTYLSKSNRQYLGVTINYKEFASKPDSTTTDVSLKVRNIKNFVELWEDSTFRSAVEAVGLDGAKIQSKDGWTMVLLEDLKPKSHEMTRGRLRWVLSTAMPISDHFKLYLNGQEVKSRKETFETVVDFQISQLPSDRLAGLEKTTGYEWSVDGDSLVSKLFSQGITGRARVTKRTLATGKSAEVFRSEGFFVYVRGRLVNEEDARFGLHELSHATLNRFRAEVYVDDLDAILTANRESMEDVSLYHDVQALLNEVFNEARQQYETYLKKERDKLPDAREEQRNWVPERLVEYPIADSLRSYSVSLKGSEPDDSWMYLSINAESDIEELSKILYSRNYAPRQDKYQYKYVALGRSERLVRFDPNTLMFTINQDHELVVAYAGEPVAQRLINDIVTSEALLEVYLREANVEPRVIGEVLERRDLLLRGLANAQMFSLTALSEYIRDSYNKSTDLEIAVVAGVRSLGFVDKHMGGSGQPDGVARFTDYPTGEQIIILEAKSSTGVPSAKDINFSSIAVHMEDSHATGCLLVAPKYPGNEDGNSAKSARDDKISCWTVKQLADVVKAAESREISARDILKIVTERFSPGEVDNAVCKLLDRPAWTSQTLYVAIMDALRQTLDILSSSPRSVTMIATQIAQMEGFDDITEESVRAAVANIAAASKGALLLRSNGNIILNVECDELDRRVQSLTGKRGKPRRKGAFGEGP